MNLLLWITPSRHYRQKSNIIFKILNHFKGSETAPTGASGWMEGLRDGPMTVGKPA